MSGSDHCQPRIHPFVSRRSTISIAVGIFAVALLVRGLYLFESSDNPTFFFPLVDSHTYHNMAAQFAADSRMDSRYFWHPFFYPFFLSTVYRLTGPSILAAKIFQALLGSVSCVLSYFLARRIFSPAVAVVAGLITAFYAPLIFFETELIAAGWAAFWAVALCLLLLRAAEKPTVVRSLLLGLCSVLAVITRPVFLPFCLAAWIWLVWRWTRQLDLRRCVICVVAFLAGFAAVAVPLSLGFKHATDRFTILPYSGGINLYIGNNPDSCRTLLARPGSEWEQLVARPRLQGFQSPPDQQAYFLQLVRQYAITDPAGFGAGIGRKLLQFVSSREIPRNIDPYLFSRWSLILSVLNFKAGAFGFPFGLLFPLSLLGLIAYRRQIPPPLWLILLLYPAAIIAVFVSGRYRIPIVPVLAITAAAGAGFIVQTVRQRRSIVLLLSVVLIVGVVALGSLPGPFCQELPNYEAEMYHGLGSFYHYPAGRLAKASVCFSRAVELDPDYVDAHVALGNVRQLQGRGPEALACFDTALRISPNHRDALNSRGLTYLDGGYYDRAIHDFDQVIRSNPAYPSAYHNRGIAYARKGDFDSALRDLDQAIALNPDYADAYNSRGLIYRHQGDYERAIRDFDQALLLQPDFVKSYNDRGLAYLRQGNYEQAIRDFRKVIDLNPDHPSAHNNLKLAETLRSRTPSDLPAVEPLNP